MKRCIIITGGYHTNLGSQAMLYHVVSNVAERFPDREIVLFVPDYESYERKGLGNFHFRVLPWKLNMKYACLGSFPYGFLAFLGCAWRKDRRQSLGRVRAVLGRADMAFDVGGFALSSQWQYISSLKYLMHIAVMAKYGVATYLLPQSFGPFHYNPLAKMILFPLMRKYLPYPQRIFAREDAGLRDIQKFTRDNLRHRADTVLLSQEIDVGRIYKSPPEFRTRKMEIPVNSVAIIPNIKVMENTDQDRLLAVYRQIISYLLETGRSVFVFPHSAIDRRTCESLRKHIAAHPGLVFQDFELDSLEIVQFLSRFEIVLPARYHALVHAYKAGTPALVFGWSAKYREMMSLLGQERYLFDVREDIETESILAALNILLARRQDEAQVIKEKLGNLQKEYDVFS